MLLVPQPHSRSPALRELVRHGAAAVPRLVAHLGDRRPTRLTIRHPLGRGGPTFGGALEGFFGGLEPHPLSGRERPPGYTLTVGDLCYVALGQIVNRLLREHGARR